MMKRRITALLLALALLTGFSFAAGEELALEGAEDFAIAPELEVPGDEWLLPEAPAEVEAVLPEDLEADAPGDAAGREGVLENSSIRLPDSDTLFAGYIDRLFGAKTAPGAQRNGIAGEQFTGLEKAVYDYLAEQIKKVAAGERASTSFNVPTSIVPLSKCEGLFDALYVIRDALFADYPYDLFWVDRSVATSFGYDGGGLFLDMAVASEYAKDDYTVNTALLKTAQTAAKTAKAVVKQYAGLSDYEKLRAYLYWICEAVDYNDDAVAGPLYYGSSNPWQPVWVFDGDPTTNVVCEGYSKAFQYLCDMSSFNNDILCISVSGTFVQDGSGGAHMWNIVRMGDNKNYLVDVTHSDDAYGTSEDVFLKGYSAKDGSDTYQYLHHIYVMYEDGTVAQGEITYPVYYIYDSSTLSGFPASALALSGTSYDPASAPAPTKVKVSKCAIALESKAYTYTGKAIKPAVTVKYGSKTLKKGTDYTVKYTGNKEIGTATVTITGKGRYTGTKKVTFTINPKATTLSKLTPGSKKLTVKWKKKSGVTGYQLQYGLKKGLSDAKTVTVKKAETVTKTIKSLTKGKKYYVRVRTYKTVDKKNYYSAWSAVTSAKVK